MDASLIATYIVVPTLAVAFIVLGVVSWRQGRRVGDEKDEVNHERIKKIHTS